MGPCYKGICLPKNILDLFPHRGNTGTYVSRCTQDVELLDLPISIKQQFMVEFMSECDESSVSSLSDISSTTSKRSKANDARHHRNLCLLCCRTTLPNLTPSLKDYSMYSNRIDTVDGETIGSAAASTNMTPQRRKNGRATIYSNASELAFNSPDSLLHEDNTNDKIVNQVLLHVQRMANPVWSKQSRMALFKLKQAHQHVFQDICVYSEVCKALGRNTYRLNARRFLQELFLDLDYNAFYGEAQEIIKTKENDISACDISMDVEPTPQSALATSSPVEKPRPPAKVAGDPRVLPTASATLPYSIKPHLLKSPPLASVYETSRENLSESFGNSSRIMNASCMTNNKSDTENSLVDHPGSVLSSTPKTNAELTAEIVNQRTIDGINYTNNDRRRYSRPRFNTLELDLSCTKNKFPITDRRKNFDTVTSIISNSALYSQRITKSLSASITAPTSVLFCEKRLNSSKSEAILSNHVTSSTANGDQSPFRQ